MLLLLLWARVGGRGVVRRRMEMKRGRWGVRMGISFVWGWGFFGDDDDDVGGNVGVGGLLMRWRGCVRDAFPSLCSREDIYMG